MAKQLGAGGGYDYEFVDAPPKSLECSICLLTLRDPHVVSCCGNHFCHSCISFINNKKNPCPLCKEPEFTTFLHKGVAREVNALMVYCPNKPQGCDWQGEIGQVEKHLNPGDNRRENGCSFVMVECKYKCGGRFQQKLITNHEIQECLNRPLEVQMAHIMKEFKSLAAENIFIKQEIVAIKQENKAEKEFVKQELVAIKAEALALQAENVSLKKQLEIHSPPTPVPPVFFRVNNYTLLKSNDSVVRSPPFYSHPGGYKMEIEVDVNGYGTGYQTHLTVCIRILRGEYDDQLEWPFKGTIVIAIYDEKKKEFSNHHQLQLDEKCACKPKRDYRGNVSFGYHQFCTHNALTEQYLSEWNSFDLEIADIKF